MHVEDVGCKATVTTLEEQGIDSPSASSALNSAYQQHCPEVAEEVTADQHFDLQLETSLQFARLNLYLLLISSDWCVWHTTEVHCSIQQPRKRKDEKKPGKGGLLGLPLFDVLKAAMCLFGCKMHLLHSMDLQMKLEVSSLLFLLSLFSSSSSFTSSCQIRT